MKRLKLTLNIAFVAAAGIAGLLLAQAQRPPAQRPPAPRTTLPREIPPATGYATEDAFGSLRFRGPLGMVAPAGVKDQLFVIERGGRIIRVNGLGSAPTSDVFLDLPAMLKAKDATLTLSTEGEGGMLGLALHPDFARNGQFYVAYSLAAQEDGASKLYNRLSRFTTLKADRTKADPESEQPLLTQLDPSPNHNGGDLHFGPDGYLYYSVGDSGVPNDGAGNAGKIDRDFFAAIFRLDVDSKTGNLKPNAHTQSSTRFPSAVHEGTYLVPNDNPFLSATTHRGAPIDPSRLRTETYATGLRNSWRMSFDPPTGRLFAADVGEGTTEEVNVIVPGGDYGWSLFEGSSKRRDVPPAVAARLVKPELQYGRRGEVSGASISGGFIYRGDRFPELQGAYVFSDFVSRKVMAFLDVDGTWVPRLLAIDGNTVAVAPDPPSGDILIADMPGGKIRRLVRADPKAVIPLPATLSETKVFADVRQRSLVDGFLPYNVNAPQWADGAEMSRWFALPTNGRLMFNADRNWGLPNGTIWVQHFDLQTKPGGEQSRTPVETRLLVRNGLGVYGLTYRWRDDGSDADLVAAEGADRTIERVVDGKPVKQVWRYPARTDCISCHTEPANYALGFNTRQLNQGSQIKAMSDAGVFNQPVGELAKLPAHVNPYDAAQPIEARARAYLAVNCAQCHQPGGTGLGRFDARPGTPLKDAAIVDGPLLNHGGDPSRRVVVAGDCDRSMALLRMNGKGGPRMPPVGTNVPDTQGIELLSAWIRSLNAPPSKP